MADRTAFLTANNKVYVDEFAQNLHEAGYEIVSLGRTAQLIEDRDIPVTESVELAARAGCDLSAISAAPERARRGIIAGYLSQMMEMDRERLRELNWPSIDLVYVDLMPPEPTESKPPGGLQGIKYDAGGIQMISSAVIGQRTVLVDPYQLPSYPVTASPDAEDTNQSKRNRKLSIEALHHLRDYQTIAHNLGRVALI